VIINILSYLPPPVMAVIGNEYTEVSQRAAIITTALTWLIGMYTENHLFRPLHAHVIMPDNIPVSVLPPALGPVILALQSLIPYVGYIGAFIAWSWGAIKQFDKGLYYPSSISPFVINHVGCRTRHYFDCYLAPSGRTHSCRMGHETDV
jgi:hypothetical protein